MKYDHQKVEKKWMKKWLEERTYEPDLDGAKKPFFNLMMFPYPSAEGLHVGNMYAFTGSDIYGRYQRMQGNDVFEPIGLDGFGIHSENYAMKIGTHPIEQAKVSEKRFYEQLQKIGNGFAWEEHLETYDPEYYRWTQWIFTQMWKHGLAYRKKQLVNWCPKDLTVLADEQVEGGKCERCGTEVVKKDLEQWSFRITNYADRLLKNLKTLDWSEKVKIAQKNWIGKSEGAEITFKIKGSSVGIKVFTTRPDTLFGATYLVIAPEHEALKNLESRIQNPEEIKKYIEIAKKKKESERIEEKEKTGVELKGVKAINPANNEEIPIWVADYVLGSYGTGAIMAVPAHDERDFAFAKKFNLPIRQVIAEETGISYPDEERRDGGCGVIFNPKTQKYAVAQHVNGLVGFFGGGVENNEDLERGVLREVAEESGLGDFDRVERIKTCFTHYYNHQKQMYRSAFATCFLGILKSDAQHGQKLEPHEKGITLAWMTPEEIVGNWESRNKNHDLDHWFIFLRESVVRAIELDYDTTNRAVDFPSKLFVDNGIVINSGKFDGMDSEAAKWEITKLVDGERKTQFRLRDWLVGRQRYWGPPIPMVFCDACAMKGIGEQKDMPGWYAVPETELPVLLPKIKDFQPKGTGVSPLAADKDFYETKCPGCGGPARRETDIIDNFIDSSWYYLRYLDPKNDMSAVNADRAKRWLPVAMCIGGAEHSVLHLLYVRFVAMALHDWGFLDFEEPFKKFRAHGLVIKDGAKMSKSKGNVINPDEYVVNFGADTLRMYLMFMAPFEDGGDFRDQAILGIARFLERVWKMAGDEWQVASGGKNVLLHKTIKKVGEDVASLHYNTAISAMMICLRELEEKDVSQEDFETFLKLLAPFAPFMTEEIWRETLGHKTSIHHEAWPVYDSSIIKEETVTLVLQVNSRTRGTVTAAAEVSETDATALALASESVKMYLAGKEPKKIIYVPGKLVNIVV